MPVVGLGLAYILVAATYAPKVWAISGIALCVIGFAAFSYARLSVFRTRGTAWGTRGMTLTSRKLYWGGYILMVSAMVVVMVSALANMATQ